MDVDPGPAPGQPNLQTSGMLKALQEGCHANPKRPLPFLSIASRKNHVALHHMGVQTSPELLDWLVKAWPEQAPEKLDMGKSCIRFNKIDDIPHALLGDLVSKMGVQAWIDLYEVQNKRG